MHQQETISKLKEEVEELKAANYELQEKIKDQENRLEGLQ